MNRNTKCKNDMGKEVYREVLLEPNKKQGLTKERFYTLVSEEDYDNIKNFNWKIAMISGNLTAVAFTNGNFRTITSVMWPNLKRVHRVNDNTLDNRRSNVKFWINKKKAEKQKTNVGQDTLETNEKEEKSRETKMLVVTEDNYFAVKKIAKDEGLGSVDKAVTVLLESHKHYKELIKHDKSSVEVEEPKTCSCDCHISFWDRFKAKIGIL